MTHLIFLHGVGGGHHAWDGQLGFFAERGYAAHAWDQPGYGHTPAIEPYDLEGISASLERLIRSLGSDPVVLIGHSMGGFIAQETYARNPKLVKGLVLAFTSPAFAGRDSEFARQFIRARIAPLDQGKSMAEVAAAVMPGMRGARSQAEGLAHAQSLMAGIDPQTYRNAVQLLTTFDRRGNLPSIAVPTLLVAGSEDRTAPAQVMERMAAKIPGAEFAVLEGCGHLGPMDQPDAFNAVVADFLARRSL